MSILKHAAIYFQNFQDATHIHLHSHEQYKQSRQDISDEF